MLKNKFLRYLLMVIFPIILNTSTRGDVGFYAKNYNWEQNSWRPIRIWYSPPETVKIIGIDAYVSFESSRLKEPTLLYDYVTGLTKQHNMNYELSSIKYSCFQGPNDSGWWVSPGQNRVFDLQFKVLPEASPGTTTLGWRTPEQIGFSGSRSGDSPYSNLTGAVNTQSITITRSASPEWGSPTGVQSVESLDTGNALRISWDKTNLSDVTPFDITVDNYDSSNLKFNIYRSTLEAGPFEKVWTTKAGDTTWQDGNNDGAWQNGEVWDMVKYFYRVRAFDNTLDHWEEQNTVIKSGISHDYTPPLPPTLKTKSVSDIPGISQPFFWRYDGSKWVKVESFLGYLPGDGKITLYWNKGAAPDYAGCLALMNESNSWEEPQSAHDDEDGKNYKVEDKIGGATVVATGDVESVTVEAENAKPFYFKIYSYDRCKYDGYPQEQGRNYSAGLSSFSAEAGVPPANPTKVIGVNNDTDKTVTVSWKNPTQSWFGGVRVVAKSGGYPMNPGDGTLIAEVTGETSTYIFYNVSNATSYKVTVFSFNKETELTKRRYSSGAQASYDTTPPGSVRDFTALPAGEDQIYLTWKNPPDADLGGVIILRKTGTSEFVYKGFPANGSTYSVGQKIFDDPTSPEVVVFSSLGISTIDPSLEAGKPYFYRIWAYDTSYNYSTTYDSTGSIPGAISRLLSFIITFASQVPEGGIGINSFAMPFASPWYVYQSDGTTPILYDTVTNEVKNAYQLVKAINAAAGENVVSTFGKWDKLKQAVDGVVIQDKDPKKAKDNLEKIVLEQGEGYQAYVTKDVTIVIKNMPSR